MATLEAHAMAGTVLEIRITEISSSHWRWLLCAVEPEGVKPPHRASWGGIETTANAAFAHAMRRRTEMAREMEAA